MKIKKSELQDSYQAMIDNVEEFVVKEGRPFAQIYNFSASFIQDVNKNVSHVVRAALDATASTADPTDPQSSHLYS